MPTTTLVGSSVYILRYMLRFSQSRSGRSNRNVQKCDLVFRLIGILSLPNIIQLTSHLWKLRCKKSCRGLIGFQKHCFSFWKTNLKYSFLFLLQDFPPNPPIRLPKPPAAPCCNCLIIFWSPDIPPVVQ